MWRWGPTRAMTSLFTKFLDHTQRRNTVCSTPVEEWSARHRDLYLTTRKTQTNVQLPEGFELTTSRGEPSQTYALDLAGTGTNQKAN
jgi:hypothetical protein